MPEGATPKDGPSAGVGMLTAIVSALTRTPVRSDVAMTGEITLRGEVLPVGGLKEKLLAALRGGIRTVLIPDENERELAEIPKDIKQDLDIRPVKWVDEVLTIALEKTPGRPRGGSRRGAHPRSARGPGGGHHALSPRHPGFRSDRGSLGRRAESPVRRIRRLAPPFERRPASHPRACRDPVSAGRPNPARSAAAARAGRGELAVSEGAERYGIRSRDAVSCAPPAGA